MTNEELQKLVEKVSQEVFKKEFKHQATFNSRLKTTGGRYFLNSHQLDFNHKVLEIHGIDIFIKIIIHELCHYHLHLAGKGHAHKDKDFKELLLKTGGLRYTPPLANDKSSYLIGCVTCDKVFKRRKKMTLSKYLCPCGGKLTYLS